MSNLDGMRFGVFEVKFSASLVASEKPVSFLNASGDVKEFTRTLRISVGEQWASPLLVKQNSAKLLKKRRIY